MELQRIKDMKNLRMREIIGTNQMDFVEVQYFLVATMTFKVALFCQLLSIIKQCNRITLNKNCYSQRVQHIDLRLLGSPKECRTGLS